MKHVLIINAHQPYDNISQGSLNSALVTQATELLESANLIVKHTASADGYDVASEIEKHQWADLVILQSPVNWMGVPWSFKKYMDEVYSAGMGGQLCQGDGRRSQEPTKHYGAGGTLTGTKYMLSLTFNAPKEAFNTADEYLFQGKTVDDLWFPQHMNFRFFGMEGLPTFACYDVMKNPDIANDFSRFEAHIRAHVINA